MSERRKYKTGRTIVAAISVLGFSLGIAQATASRHVTVNAAGNKPSGQEMQVAASTSKVQTNQRKSRNPVSSRTTVKPGQANTLSPQPLPPGSR